MQFTSAEHALYFVEYVTGVTVTGVTLTGVTVTGVTVTGVPVTGVTVTGVTVTGFIWGGSTSYFRNNDDIKFLPTHV